MHKKIWLALLLVSLSSFSLADCLEPQGAGIYYVSAGVDTDLCFYSPIVNAEWGSETSFKYTIAKASNISQKYSDEGVKAVITINATPEKQMKTLYLDYADQKRYQIIIVSTEN